MNRAYEIPMIYIYSLKNPTIWMKRSEIQDALANISSKWNSNLDLPKALIVVDDLHQNCENKPDDFKFVPSFPNTDLM